MTNRHFPGMCVKGSRPLKAQLRKLRGQLPGFSDLRMQLRYDELEARSYADKRWRELSDAEDPDPIELSRLMRPFNRRYQTVLTNG